MKNLKRALSLVLSTVMLMGMMVVGTGAGYADVDSNDNKVAIEVLQAVGVMEGDENGNFNPDKAVTRNEMAVVMTKLLGLTPGGVSPFTDVPAWAQPYVAACYSNGIIAGVSATEFNGSANVTAAQASLMVMKALGYFGFQGEFGSDWKVATVKQATKIDLYDGISAYTDMNLTRNDVAQLVLNALEADVIVADEVGGMTVEGNGITVIEKARYTYTPVQDNEAHDYNGAGPATEDYKYLQLTEKLFGDDLKKDTSVGICDDFKRPATQWTYQSKTIKAAKAPTKVYTKGVTGKAILNDLGKPALGSYTVSYYVDGDTSITTGEITSANTNNLVGSGKGAVTEAYLNTSAKTLDIVIYKYYLAKVTSVFDKEAETINLEVYGNDNTLSYVGVSAEDFPIVKTLNKDDYLVVTLTTTDAAATAANTILRSIALANVSSGLVVNEARDTDYVLAGGTKYEYSDITEQFTSSEGYDKMSDADVYALGEKYNLYLDPNGYVLGVKGASAAFDLSKYLFLVDDVNNGFDRIAKVVFTDGTSKSVIVSKVIDSNGTYIDVDKNTDLTQDDFYTFKVIKDGTYELTKVGQAGGASYKVAQDADGFSDSDALSIQNNGYFANDDTVYLAKKTVTVGFKNAPDVSTGSGYTLVNDSNAILFAYFPDGGAVAGNDQLVYALSSTPAHANDGKDDYLSWKVVINGEVTTLNTCDDQTMTEGLVYTIDSYEGAYANVSPANATDHVFTKTGATSASFNASTLILDGVGYNLAKDAVIRTIDNSSASSVAIAASSIKTAVEVGSDKYNNVVMIMNKDDDVVLALYLTRH